MEITVRKVELVRAFGPGAAIGSYQTLPAQLTDDQEDGPEVNMPVTAVAESAMPSPVVAESPALSELRNTSHVVPLLPAGAAVHEVPLGHQVIYGSPAPAAVQLQPVSSYFRFPVAPGAVQRPERARSAISCSIVNGGHAAETPKPATMAFESTYLPASDRAQPMAMYTSSSFASASGGAYPDCVAETSSSGPRMQTPSLCVHDLLPPMDFIFYKDPNSCVAITEDSAAPRSLAPAEPVPRWKNMREILVKADNSHAQSLEHLATQIQDLMGSQMKLNTELRELKQQVYSNCQDLEGIRREAQNRFVTTSHRYSTAPRLSPPPVVSTEQPADFDEDLTNFPASSPTSTSMTTKNLGYDNTEDMLANVRGHAARGLETLHRHTARAVQHFSDSSWLAGLGRLSSRSY